MKTMKRLLAFTLLALMLVSLSVAAWADDTYSITIRNSYKDKTYSVYKILNAEAAESGDGVSYYVTAGTAKGALASEKSPFAVAETADANGRYYVTLKEGKTASNISTWIKDNIRSFSPAVKTATGTGKTLTIDGLTPGYYYITSGQGSIVTIDTATKNVEVIDKNPTEIIVTKEADKESYSIGDTITFTATFTGLRNYELSGNTSYPVVKYEIKDTLPEYLTDVTVTSIKVNNTAITTKQFVNKKIDIEWATKSGDGYNFKYEAPATIELVYTAKLTSTVNIDTANTNKISIQPWVDKGNGNPPEPWNDPYTASKEIRTYAAAIKKVDEAGNPLTGAQFTIQGLVVEGANGIYTVKSYDPRSTTESAVLDTDENGMLYIVGLGSDVELTVTEYKAPDGYNSVAITEKLKPQLLTVELYTESGVRYYDADGNLVKEESSSTSRKDVDKNLSELDAKAFTIINQKGVQLPSTGGEGVILFYAIGTLLIAAAAMMIVSKRRHNEG